VLRFAKTIKYFQSVIFAIAHSALSPALGHEPFGSEIKAELLEPNGLNKYLIEFMNRGTKFTHLLIISIGEQVPTR